VAGRPGVNVEGYRDYRGSLSYGAWTWLDKYGIGVGTEVDVADAARAGEILVWAFWGLFALLAVSSAAIFVFTILMARLQQQARHAALSAKKLGQYALEEKIGAGGMGVVYRGHHAMLRRPTAIKLLDVENTTDEGIKRFEREVSLTSQLNHPNTIAIYDYGRTPEGIFYYAMELLEGLDLESLVRVDGPQPEGRVIHILVQVCGSLGEAHRRGLIHRDIKPANIFLTERGGVPDFVKLLDFGLVKAVDGARETQVTRTGALTGTPLYMPPEAIQHPDEVDARSDLYALGAVGYFLATGSPPFDGKSIVELCTQHVSATPQSPSARLGKPLSAEFEAAILWCLEKTPADRPESAAALAAALRKCPTAGSWTDADATAWWSRRAHATLSATTAESTSTPTTDHTAVWTAT
jgi:eukaryotic-like serine/threonine-protein kinase